MFSQYHAPHEVYLKGKVATIIKSEGTKSTDEVWLGDDDSIIIGTITEDMEIQAEYRPAGTVGDWITVYEGAVASAVKKWMDNERSDDEVSN